VIKSFLVVKPFNVPARVAGVVVLVTSHVVVGDRSAVAEKSERKKRWNTEDGISEPSRYIYEVRGFGSEP
jgi:hypothetical protein